ncbi:MAG: hypothetical protein HW386_377 [Gammaproteobacteria bacterium]|nr:hypothetical protein [Gammaproteobacteria bacterium]
MKKLFLSTIASALTLISTASLAEDALNGFTFSGNVALTNDYKFYGFSQSNEGFAVQGGFNINHESGFYLGVWASSIDFALDAAHHLNATPGTFEDPATIELDVLGGYAGSFSNGISYDIGGVRYGYPNENNMIAIGGELEYWEGYANFGYSFGGTYAPTVSAGINVSPDWFGETGTSIYPHGSLAITLPQEFGLYTKLGYLDVSDIDYNYFHYQIGVTKSFAGLAFDLAWADAADDCDGGTGDFCQGFIFAVSKKF